VKPGPDLALDTCAFQCNADVSTRLSLQLVTRHQDLLSCLPKHLDWNFRQDMTLRYKAMDLY
jgi:hypothetical protein